MVPLIKYRKMHLAFYKNETVYFGGYLRRLVRWHNLRYVSFLQCPKTKRFFFKLSRHSRADAYRISKQSLIRSPGDLFEQIGVDKTEMVTYNVTHNSDKNVYEMELKK